MRPAGPLVIAHRGASGEQPENTAAAYRLAVEQSSDMIEIDLHHTRDLEIVITHDENLSSLGADLDVAQATAAQVRALDAGGGEVVPTLSEVLDTFGRRVEFNLELKRGTDGPYPGLEAAAWDQVRERSLEPRMLFSSFYDEILTELRAVATKARIGVLVSPRKPERALERAREVGAQALHPHFLLADADLVRSAHSEGLAVYVWTVDDPEQMKALFDLGVDGIFTNFPARGVALRRQIMGSGHAGIA